jgi:hypothetical protein
MTAPQFVAEFRNSGACLGVRKLAAPPFVPPNRNDLTFGVQAPLRAPPGRGSPRTRVKVLHNQGVIQMLPVPRPTPVQ